MATQKEKAWCDVDDRGACSQVRRGNGKEVVQVYWVMVAEFIRVLSEMGAGGRSFEGEGLWDPVSATPHCIRMVKVFRSEVVLI